MVSPRLKVLKTVLPNQKDGNWNDLGVCPNKYLGTQNITFKTKQIGRQF